MLSFKVHSNAWKRVLYRWAYGRSLSKANGFVLVMYAEGKGRKRNDVSVL